MALWLKDMYLWLGLSPEAAKLLVREQELYSPDSLRDLRDNNVNDICNHMRKPDRKYANKMPYREQHVSVITQENQQLAAFLFHHRWRCTFDWEVMRVCEDKVHLLAGQMKLEDE